MIRVSTIGPDSYVENCSTEKYESMIISEGLRGNV
jgi:hypothetical protein